MPRIDPIKLLNCLSVLLLPNGGIKSTDEVHRLAELMTKYSKKLVSKCIYIQILKCTETGLIDLFMGSGGWRLVHMWLTESIVAKNWPLVKELLELLLLCPVGIDRLKTNNCPKLVKELSKDENHSAIRALASKLVEQWLKAVKGEQLTPLVITDIPKIITDMNNEIKAKEEVKTEIELDDNVEKSSNNIEDVPKIEEKSDNSNESTSVVATEKEEVNKEPEALPVLKITLKNGKQVISQVENDVKAQDDSQDKIEVKEIKDRHKSKSKDKSNERSSSSSRSSSSKHSSKSKSSSDKHHSHKDSSSKHNSSSSSSSSSKDRRKDKDRHSSSSQSSKSKSSSSSSSSSIKRSSSSSKSKDDKSSHRHSSEKDKSKEKDKISSEKEKSSSDKEKSADKEKSSADKDKSSTEKDKPLDKEDKFLSPSIHKLGKIPKLSDVKREKPSISIEVRKPEDPKPKTVKTFHSKFRKHGLEEEIKPPPSRASVLTKKPPPVVIPPTVSIPKRPSPVHNESPPEKKAKTIEIDKPGAIKLIPPKPKPMVLQESDMFMDALNASATNKKEPKKRKRRTSGSKDGHPSDGSPPHTPTSESKSVPPRFYQDTLDDDENKEKSTEKDSETNDNIEKSTSPERVEEKMEVSEPHTLTINGLKGVLCYHKRKGPKKSIRWKPDSELEEVQYFELDETERVNVTKTFTDMKHLERIHEREAFQKARNLTNDDIMEERTSWRPLIFVDCGDQVQVEYGKNSKERDIQAIRQKGTLQPLYFHKAMIPDSPNEPDLETHLYSEPTNIPLDDVTGNVSDFRNMPWPEPKGNAPPQNSNNINVPPLFSSNMSQFPPNFPPAQFPGAPGFQGPPVLPGDWPTNGLPVMPNGMPGPMGPPVMPPGALPPGAMPPGAMPPGGMPPGMMGPPDGMMMGPKMFPGPNPMFPGPPDGFNMPQNMFPGDFNMAGSQGPPGPDGFAGPGNFRGAMRGRGIVGHWRGKPNGSFDGSQRGRGGARGGRMAVCIHFQRKGSCRQGDSCSFLHPGVNCPY